MLIQIAYKVNKYLGYFCKKICSQDVLKIAQSGHTGGHPNYTTIFLQVNLVKFEDYLR